MPLDIAIAGTRGIPANYGGFETFAEELSHRLVQRGHRVTVYGRSHYVDPGIHEYQGVRLITLPAIRSKYLETVSHAALSSIDLSFRHFDVVLFCNAATAFACLLPRLAGRGVVLNVDGIERKRRKWNRWGRGYYRLSERLATLLPHRIVTDARTIQSYYLERYGQDSEFIPYGASTERCTTTSELDRLGMRPQEYLLYVSRLEPENNAHLVVEAFLKADLDLPLVLVGDAPYSRRYIEELRTRAASGNILMPGGIYGRGYRELLSHCLCYLHATEVGGTHPALVEAMGAGALVIVHDNAENREVVGECGLSCDFSDTSALAELMREAVARRSEWEELRQRAVAWVGANYDWERITDRYEALFDELTG